MFLVFAFKPASPRGRKRGKRVDNGETISDTEGEFEHSAPTPKKGKLENDKSSKGGNSGAGVIIKGTSRTGRKSVDKTESAKKVGKKPELGKEPEEDLDENTPAKRKRGRPKGSGKKDDGISGDEIAGPSSDSTPTTSVKKGKSATLLPDSGKRKPGRPAKNKSEDDLQEKTSQKKEKVNIYYLMFLVLNIFEHLFILETCSALLSYIPVIIQVGWDLTGCSFASSSLLD